MRWPWKKHQLGLVVVLAGLLALSVGTMQTFIWGAVGQLSLKEGESCEHLVVTNRNVITATRLVDRGQVSTDFTFAPGQTDWSERKSLDFGQEEDLGLKVVKFIQQARERVDWVADARDYEGPALELRLCGPGGGWVDEDWLAASLFGGEAVIGPTMYQLWPLPVATMLDDFLHPPSEPETTSGTLSIHYEGQMSRVPVDGNLGSRLPLGDTGIEVEIVDRFLDAKPKQEGGFFSRSSQPRNPLLELKIYFPGRAEPVRQIAFAKNPLVNLDGVHGSICPVRFWYHHPQLQRTPGAVFAQTPDGQLYCRPVVEGEYRDANAVEAGGEVPIGGGFSIHVLSHIPRARREVSFSTVEPTQEDDANSESAALVEVTLGGTRREIWLQRENPRYGAQTISTDSGPLNLSFGYQRLPLGYQIQLDDFVHASNPDQADDANFTSLVRLTDPATHTDEKREISLRQPLTHGKFTLYQTSQQQLTHGVETSTLQAIYDPGRLLRYWGGLMTCVGIAILASMRAFSFVAAGQSSRQASAARAACIAARQDASAAEQPIGPCDSRIKCRQPRR